jgi:hypothetical protein
MDYFLIHITEERDMYVQRYSKEALLQVIKEEDFGTMTYVTQDSEDWEQIGPMHWQHNTLIIKGEVAIPKPIEIVKEYDI